jgi:hypothetical protein
VRLRGRIMSTIFVAWCLWGYWSLIHAPNPDAQGSCDHQTMPVAIKVSVSKYPDNWRHIVDARHGRNTVGGTKIVNDGLRWPVELVKNDQGEEQRRQAAFRLAGLAGKTKPGMARDEYPPAEGRSTDAADIRYVPARPNSAQGASMGGQLRKWCNGQHYKLVAVP